MKKILLILMIGIVLISFTSAEQVLWNNDTNIDIYDTWRDIDGIPLTGATCSWQVYNLDGSISQSGIPSEFSNGVFNFTVSQLNIGIYPLLINCTKNNYNGTSSKDSIKIIDELSEEYKGRLVEINQTTHNIYDLLLNDMNATLSRILNYTELTYSNVVDLGLDIDILISQVNDLKDYLEEKWGNKDADKIYDKLKDIKSDLSYLKSEFYYLSAEARQEVLLSIKRDSREILEKVYGGGGGDGFFIWIIPIVVVIIIIIIVIYLSKRKSKGKGLE